MQAIIDNQLHISMRFNPTDKLYMSSEIDSTNNQPIGDAFQFLPFIPQPSRPNNSSRPSKVGGGFARYVSPETVGYSTFPKVSDQRESRELESQKCTLPRFNTIPDAHRWPTSYGVANEEVGGFDLELHEFTKASPPKDRKKSCREWSSGHGTVDMLTMSSLSDQSPDTCPTGRALPATVGGARAADRGHRQQYRGKKSNGQVMFSEDPVPTGRWVPKDRQSQESALPTEESGHGQCLASSQRQVSTLLPPLFQRVDRNLRNTGAKLKLHTLIPAEDDDPVHDEGTLKTSSFLLRRPPLDQSVTSSSLNRKSSSIFTGHRQDRPSGTMFSHRPLSERSVSLQRVTSSSSRSLTSDTSGSSVDKLPLLDLTPSLVTRVTSSPVVTFQTPEGGKKKGKSSLARDIEKSDDDDRDQYEADRDSETD